MSIKAIETLYSGYRFRSRLEARWAVFFENMYIDYEYEYEGFELSDGTKYLPDFWLPRFQTFVEIKGADQIRFIDNVRSVHEKKIEMLSRETGMPAMLCYGAPKECWCSFYGWATHGDGGGVYGYCGSDDRYATFGMLDSPKIIVLDDVTDMEFCSDFGRTTQHNIISRGDAKDKLGLDIINDEFYTDLDSYGRGDETIYSFEQALKARRARFEYEYKEKH